MTNPLNIQIAGFHILFIIILALILGISSLLVWFANDWEVNELVDYFTKLSMVTIGIPIVLYLLWIVVQLGFVVVGILQHEEVPFTLIPDFALILRLVIGDFSLALNWAFKAYFNGEEFFNSLIEGYIALIQVNPFFIIWFVISIPIGLCTGFGFMPEPDKVLTLEFDWWSDTGTIREEEEFGAACFTGLIMGVLAFIVYVIAGTIVISLGSLGWGIIVAIAEGFGLILEED